MLTLLARWKQIQFVLVLWFLVFYNRCLTWIPSSSLIDDDSIVVDFSCAWSWSRWPTYLMKPDRWTWPNLGSIASWRNSTSRVMLRSSSVFPSLLLWIATRWANRRRSALSLVTFFSPSSSPSENSTPNWRYLIHYHQTCFLLLSLTIINVRMNWNEPPPQLSVLDVLDFKYRLHMFNINLIIRSRKAFKNSKEGFYFISSSQLHVLASQWGSCAWNIIWNWSVLAQFSIFYSLPNMNDWISQPESSVKIYICAWI